MNVSTKVAYNTLIQIISKVLATLLGLFTVGIITRYLGDAGYGQYTTVITYLSFFGIIADMGLTLITVQLISRPGADEKKILGNLLSLRLFSALLFLCLAPILIWFFPYADTIKLGVAIAAASFLFTAINQIFVGFFQKRLRMDKVSIAEVLSRLFLLLGAYLAWRWDRGLSGILWATVLSSFVNFLYLWLSARKMTSFRLCYDARLWKEILVLSWPLALTISLNLIYLRSDILLLSLIPRPSEIGIIAEVGLYGAAYKIIDVLITVPFMFSGLILPFLSAAWAKKNIARFNRLSARSFELLLLVSLPFAAGAQIVSEELMVMVAGPDFRASGPILRLLIFASLFVFAGNIFAHGVIALEKQKKIIGAYIFTAFSSLALYLLLIPKVGYMGAAWVTVYSEATIALASLYIVKKYTGFKFNFLPVAKYALCSLLMGLAVYSLKNYLNVPLVLNILTGALIYIVLLFAFKAISRKEIKILLNRG